MNLLKLKRLHNHSIWKVLKEDNINFLSLVKNVAGIGDMNECEVLCPKGNKVSNGHDDLFIHNQKNFYRAVL